MKILSVKLLVCIMLFSLSFVASETSTTLNIQNNPIYLIKNIEDTFILGDKESINIIDLDEYFIKDSGEDFNITYSPLENVLVTIDSEHQVSFYPTTGYIGTQSMNFSAEDSLGTTHSNNFNLIVGEDTIPPKWFNPRKDRISVYQNHHVIFTTFWEDDIGLTNYIFSINQGSGWVNSSEINFSGQQNTSTNRVQILASPLTTVFWRFYASDEGNNLNATTIQNFSVNEYIFSGDYSEEGESTESYSSDEIIIIPILAEIFSHSIIPSGFKVSISSLKISILQGDTITKVIKIKNIGDIQLEISAYLKETSIFGILSDNLFTIEPGETKELLIEFKIPEDTMPEQYYDILILKSTESKIIPIIIDVRTFQPNISITTFISEENKVTDINEEIVATVTIQNLGDIRNITVDLFYAIKDFQGNIMESGNKEVTLSKLFEENISLTVPEDTLEGEYIFYARVIYDDLVDLDSSTFFIGYRFKMMSLIKKFIYPVIITIMLVVIITLILIYKKAKKKKRALELYLLLNELKSLVKKGKTSEAIEIYKRIKISYGQSIPKGFSEDKEKLKTELEKFSKLLKQNDATIPTENSPDSELKEPIEETSNLKTEINSESKSLTQQEPSKKLSTKKEVAPSKKLKLLDKNKPAAEKSNET